MTWREAVYSTVFGYAGTSDERTGVIADALEDRLLDMQLTDRIALARELLAGTGRVVARDVGAATGAAKGELQRLYNEGWDDCRKAMTEDTP